MNNNGHSWNSIIPRYIRQLDRTSAAIATVPET